ncbi:uncharacterized protein BCR38DRAFT_356904 [Pseudomassariella vexata]|uniref:Spc7 kinetochore protein domain-containing protein n=1 Tax=Pseudomassariella vexata TaxID=1141098 RepID=A0A1Y2D890_9PEZI|nr:uncharacterized protein BCR38DRAFT_356904 [Pseudomassariella vexata]ORY55480.1 hypothetical protein BCR38DRAFT_356904 [Pseudomassariella vexata]
MASHADAPVPALRRPRKSTGHSPVRKRMEKENITVDMASSLAGNSSRKKSRSKSMGPGGLDVLMSGSGNRRVSLAASTRPPPRSILKPTIPIPEIPPHKPKSSRNGQHPSSVQGAEKLPNQFQNEEPSSGTKIAVRTEEQQQAAAREREEKERLALEKEIKDRREARRKSLANRRVSFAAEATLHTFHEVEYMQDSTTSTDSTRRASSLAAHSPAPAPHVSDPSDPPSTPPEQVEDLVPESPEDQRNLHQKQRRRSSGVGPLSYSNTEENTMASTVYSSDSDATDGVIETNEEINSDSGSDSDADDGTSMDIDIDEVTGTSIASARSFATDDSNDTLDDALRLAARQAQTQSIDEEEEIIPSFGWAKKPAPKPDSPDRNKENLQINTRNWSHDDEDEDDDGMDMDMEMTHAVGGIVKSNTDDDDQEAEMSMDVTKAFGGIIPQQASNSRRKSVSPAKSGEGSLVDDETMDLTMAIGAIRQAKQPEEDLLDLESNFGGNEDMSMELTSVIGGVLASNKAGEAKRKSLPARRRTLTTANDEATMDMTVGLGRILPADRIVDTAEDDTMGMDMTMAIGGIIGGPSAVKDRSLAKQVMEEEVNEADDSTPILRASPTKRRLSAMLGVKVTPGTRSLSVSAMRSQGARHPSPIYNSSPIRNPSPIRDSSPVPSSSPFKSFSPVKEVTPKAKGPSTPSMTPLSKKVQSRSVSPRRQIAVDAISTPKPARNGLQRASNIFQRDPETGASTPRVVLTPQNRRLSGLGADRPGLGSPKVAATLDRRGSIGEAAGDFVPGRATRGVTFADPRIIEEEIDKDRQDEEAKESGRRIPEREADGDDENITATLKDMIASMTPKKNRNVFKGRKSLHVGSAKGLLGKRPAELDDEDESEDRDGVKRLKGHQSSPVKNVRLHAPPSKAETTGRITRSARRSLEETSGNAATPTLTQSPSNGPKTLPSLTSTVNFDDMPQPIDPNVNVDNDGERIHLQDFLNMTSIRFMELTTTKRRHTQATAPLPDNTLQGDEDISLERCVVAGACTVPMLELYQHSCRELKKYISEGRRIVREIETETFEENPPLFQEYISATPEFKTLMDNQFKNVKTHARLLSKAMWYEWRMKLQDGLKEGLIKISEDMDDDDQLLLKGEELLKSILPDLVKKFEAMKVEHENLQAVVQELADCDPEDLRAARAELSEVDSDIEVKQRRIEELRQVLDETASAIQDVAQRKQECNSAIEEAEKVREECRGWSSKEINSLKGTYFSPKVDDLEKQHGWAITGIAGSTISMIYRREIELVFDIASFQGTKPNSCIDLWYIAANRENHPELATPEREFFVQCIRDHVRSLAQTKTEISTLLRMVSAAWQKAGAVADDIRLLNCTFPTEIVKTGDSSIAVKVAMLLAPLQTKVQIVIGLQTQKNGHGVDVAIVPQAHIVYGEHFKVDKVCEYLSTRLGSKVVTKEENEAVESWSDVIIELHERLLARGRK